MMDPVKERNLHLDIDGLSRDLDCPVVPMTASKGIGLKALKSMVLEKIERPKMSNETISRPPAIQQTLPEISALLEEKTPQTFRSQRSRDWFCQSLLESEQGFDILLGLSNSAQSKLLVIRSKLTTKLGEEPDLVANHCVLKGSVRSPGRRSTVHAKCPAPSPTASTRWC